GFALWGPFPPKLFPGVDKIAATFVRLLLNGVLVIHALGTIARLVAGFAIGGVLGVALGLAMGRSRRAEELLLPIVSVGNPIPGLAYAPLFVIWFGLGNLPAILLVAFAAAFPIAVNTWSGVRAVKEIWIRAAQSMGAQEHQLFRSVVLPGALPYVLTGLRVGLVLEKVVFERLERYTVVRWGMLTR